MTFFNRTQEFFLLLAAVACTKPPHVPVPTTGFLNRTVTVDTTTYRYQVYLPANFTSRKKWPIILFLHGAGERGDDGLLQTQVGIGAAIRQHAERFPCLVVFPQCRPNKVWAGEMETQALAALDQTVKEFNGDPEQIYLTGLSMGGYGTWQFAARHPGKFAALVPICGGVIPPADFPFPPEAAAQIPADKPYETIAAKIGKTPVWIFHGDADQAIPVSESRQMNEALQVLGGNVKYTEYPGIGHNSWDKAYAEPELMTWLLSQKLVS
ncbi:MAG: alpha/beta hydrolase-fold protein [candidate division KSB1 bacterium]|nr:alpha/beta hydrolase-fold protein [candidate division KSB1 bacterium]MDZ7302090.1 alpha/beta hydrolase-fold protein [candidate division KSB1 bacterium]MDZ7311131.1 alpha/beta hydrolase-fold protein [candidate division KSB1 bacterium]